MSCSFIYLFIFLWMLPQIHNLYVNIRNVWFLSAGQHPVFSVITSKMTAVLLPPEEVVQLALIPIGPILPVPRTILEVRVDEPSRPVVSLSIPQNITTPHEIPHPHSRIGHLNSTLPSTISPDPFPSGQIMLVPLVIPVTESIIQNANPCPPYSPLIVQPPTNPHINVLSPTAAVFLQ